MKKHKASILVVTLFILGIIITTALAVSLAAIKQRSASLGSGKSTKAFQNADAGVEAVLSEIIRGNSTTVGGVCSVISGAGYEVELFDGDGNKLNCANNDDKAVLKGKIATIKSVGQGADQQTRAIEAVAAASTLEWETLDLETGWDKFTDNFNYPVQYAKDNRTGLVYLRGAIQRDDCDNPCEIGTLDSGYRPVKHNVFGQIGQSTSSIGGIYRVDVLSSGTVRFSLGGSPFPKHFLSLDGIVFATN